MADNITTARVRLAIEGASAVEQGLAKVQGKVSDLGSAMLGLAGGITAAGFAAWVKGAIDAADQTDELAQKTGLLVEQVAGLKLLFEREGLGEQFSQTMAKLSKGASDGNKAFAAMGITVQDAQGRLKGTRELLGEVAEKFSGYRDGAEKTALAMELFGRSGADLIPLLNNGAAGIDEMDARARELGLTLSKETAAAAAQFNDNLFILKNYAGSASVSIANLLLPSLVDLSNAFVTANRYGGGLLGTLRLFGSTTYSLDGFNLSKDLAEAREELGKLAQKREQILRNAAGRPLVSSAGATKGVDEDIAGAQKRLNYLKDLERQSVKLSATDQSVAEARRLGLKTLGEYAPAMAKATQNTTAHTAASRANEEAQQEATKALRARIAAAQTSNAAFDEEFDRIEQIRLASEGRIKSAREMLESIELETAMLGMSNDERQRSIALFELERDGVVKGTEAYAAYAARIEEALGVQASRRAAIERADEEKKLAEQTVRDQAKAYEDMWKSIDDTAHDVFVSVADEGMDAFKRIGKTLKAAVLDMLYQMTVKKWIFQIAGVSGGGGLGGGNGSNLLMSAAQSYMSGGSALGASASAVGSWMTGSMSTANMAGSLYANASGTGMSGLLATNGAYGTAATGASTGAGAAAGSGGLMAAAGWAALIYAAVKYGEGLYNKGYNRSVLGEGQGSGTERYMYGRGNFTQYTEGQMNRGAARQYGYSPARFTRGALDPVMSDKWADIASGSTFWAHAWARRRNGYGYQIGLDGNNGVSVGGYESYKPGWAARTFGGKNTRTVSTAINDTDAAQVRMQVESVRDGAKAMAAAMGLSASAIDGYTGKLKINFKGANTAAEQAERMSKAMDNLQFALIKAASGGKMARDEFERLMTDARQRLDGVGITTSGIADIITQGMLGRLSQSQVGEQLGEMVLGGIYTMIVSPFAQQISQAFMSQIIQPMVVAVTTGGSISAAVSQQTIASVVAQANAAATQLQAILSDPAFRAAMAGVQQAINGISAASVKPARAVRSYGTALNRNAAAANTAREAAERLRDAWSSLFDGLIDEVRRLRGEILGTSDAGSAYTLAQFASATAAARAGDQKAAESLPELSRAVEESYRLTAQTRADLQAIRGYLLESNQITANTIGGRFGFAIPQFDVGTNYVPHDMLAVLHKGEAVQPAAYNPAAGGSDPAMLAEMRALRGEFKRVADATAQTAIDIHDIAYQRRPIATEAA